MQQNPQPGEDISQDPTPGSTILLYDGVCGLCNRFVRFVLRFDSKRSIYFAPLQSQLARAILGRHTVDASELDTVVLVLDAETTEERYLFRSDAATEVLILLGGGWAVLASLLQRLPRGFRDALYRMVARNRYRLFGRFNTCPLPTAEQRDRFPGLE